MAKEKSLIDTSKNLLTDILDDRDIEFIETGNIGFDLALSNGKGIPVGASVLLWADPGCGKSTILADVSKRLLKRSKKNNIPFKEVTQLEDAMPDVDILYMTRVQRERFFNEEEYIRMKDCYILSKEKMELAKKDMFVLHPLPRVNEISVEVDDDPRAAYFRQVQYGVYIRMALILKLLEITV